MHTSDWNFFLELDGFLKAFQCLGSVSSLKIFWLNAFTWIWSPLVWEFYHVSITSRLEIWHPFWQFLIEIPSANHIFRCKSHFQMQIPLGEWKEHFILNGNILYYKHFDSKCTFDIVILVCCNSAPNSIRINSCLYLLFVWQHRTRPLRAYA